MKSIDNVAVLNAARPDALRIFRHYFPTQNLDDPHGAADAILTSLAGYRHPNLYVETYNEIGRGDLHRYIGFLQGAIPWLHARGVRVCGPSWSTGDYEQSDWDAFRLASWCQLSMIDLHAYWGTQGFTQWHALRYRTYWRPGDPYIVISEAGRDAVEGGKGGWQKDGITAGQYVTELSAYAAETAKDAYVVGVTPFSSGPTPDWKDFTIDPLTHDLITALGYGGPPMPTVNVGTGLMKADPHIGPITQDEVIDGAGTPSEVRRISTPRGWATYDPKSNETVVFVSATGEILADGGNHWTGTLRQIRGPF